MSTGSLTAEARAAGVPARFALPVPVDERRTLAVGWLALALGALLASGAFSILLVLARAPYVKDVFPLADFFRVALVVHVDLSVLVWFSAFAGLLWSLHGGARLLPLGWAGLAGAATATAALCAAPFLEPGVPLMSNYIPVLDGPVFLGALALFALSALLVVARALAAAPRVGTHPDGAAALRFGLNAAAVSAAVALLAFAWSYAAVPGDVERKAYFEVLFWGGGHVLQFTWTLLMFAAWLWLAEAIGARVPLSPRIAILLFAIALASVFATPVIYLAYDVVSVEHYRMQTWLMRIGGGLAIVPFGAAVAFALIKAPPASRVDAPLKASLAWSLVLFGAGGLIGLAINGSNVKIPAHYHGSIVGVTLAFMGLVYYLLPRMGFGGPQGRLARLQPALYGGGQLLHIVGLLWSGGYGVQRKVAGGEQVLRSAEQIAGMGLMGLGGLLAVAGGILFAVIVVRALWTSSTSRS
ncbi:MAG TPA: cbb3-type cytochrome c oxidase subunit I [Burkholderiales bacterium]|nr:cbb3-type cytochrome c oxidase subunit I [Burkholderiales bacterium]